jgi:hypothetical protein
MGKTVAQSKGNTARKAMQRNQGLPAGIKRKGQFSSMSNMDEFLAGAKNTLDLNRRIKLLRRWKCSFGMMPDLTAK